MKHKDLFDDYKQKLNWIDRRLQPETLKFYNETAESWKHAKEIAFGMYQHLRYFCEDGIPIDCIDYKADVSNISDYVLDETSFKCIGILNYRDLQFPVYEDVYGMSNFIVLEDHMIEVSNFAGYIDWYYEVDSIIDKIYENQKNN